MIAMMMALSSLAEASCPWTTIESVTATMTSVTINGDYYPVKGSAARGAFISVLTQCDVSPTAIAAFQEWRQMRQYTNISAGVGLCLIGPVILVTPVTAGPADIAPPASFETRLLLF